MQQVNAAALKEAGIIKKELDGVKVLEGAIEKKLTVQAAKFSKQLCLQLKLQVEKLR